MEKKIDKMEMTLIAVKELLVKLNNNIEKVDKKVDDLTEMLDDDLIPECKKMGSHIDFVENVYDTVKHPLGFLCNKIKNLTGTNEKYTLTDISNSNIEL